MRSASHAILDTLDSHALQDTSDGHNDSCPPLPKVNRESTSGNKLCPSIQNKYERINPIVVDPFDSFPSSSQPDIPKLELPSLIPLPAHSFVPILSLDTTLSPVDHTSLLPFLKPIIPTPSRKKKRNLKSLKSIHRAKSLLPSLAVAKKSKKGKRNNEIPADAPEINLLADIPKINFYSPSNTLQPCASISDEGIMNRNRILKDMPQLSTMPPNNEAIL